MSFPNTNALKDWLLRAKLVTAASLDDVVRGLRTSVTDQKSFVQELERRNLLTGYQSGKLLKGDTEGLVLGQCKLLYRNASGSFARVFRGCTVDDGRMIGIKVLRSRWAKDPKAVGMFRREGELGKRLLHPNIVPIYDVGSEGNQHYFTMEFVEGGNFRDLLRIRKQFSPEEATKYILEMAAGLEYALRLGFTHRDLKLTNVLLSAQGMAKLVDFGLAGTDSAATGIEQEADRAIEYGTLERHTGVPDGDPRSDLYFLGAIYYELLTGTPPYAPTRDAAERKQISRYRNVRPIRSVNPSLPGRICEAVTRLMQMTAGDRFQTPTELIRELKDWAPSPRSIAVGADNQNQPSDEQGPIGGLELRSGSSGELELGGMLLGDQPSVPPTPVAIPAGQQRTVLCIEARVKQQDALRTYFSKHRFRVLVMSDLSRGLARLKSAPPDALLLSSDTLEDDEVVSQYKHAARQCEAVGTALVLLLAKRHDNLKPRLVDDSLSAVLSQPVILRDIRSTLARLRPDLGDSSATSRSADGNGISEAD